MASGLHGKDDNQCGNNSQNIHDPQDDVEDGVSKVVKVIEIPRPDHTILLMGLCSRNFLVTVCHC